MDRNKHTEGRLLKMQSSQTDYWNLLDSRTKNWNWNRNLWKDSWKFLVTQCFQGEAMINTYNIDLHGYSYGNCNFYGYDCFTGETLIHAMYDS